MLMTTGHRRPSWRRDGMTQIQYSFPRQVYCCSWSLLWLLCTVLWRGAVSTGPWRRPQIRKATSWSDNMIGKRICDFEGKKSSACITPISFTLLTGHRRCGIGRHVMSMRMDHPKRRSCAHVDDVSAHPWQFLFSFDVFVLLFSAKVWAFCLKIWLSKGL